MEKELHIVMRDLVSNFGADIIGSPRFKGLISDVLAGENKYAPLIKSASQYQVGEKVLALLNDRSGMQLKLDSIRQSFVAQTFVQPEIGTYIVDCYAFAIGLVSDAKIEAVSSNTTIATDSTPTPQIADTSAIIEEGTQYRYKKDYQKAAALYQQAADLGDSVAMFELGRMYHCYKPVKDEIASRSWLNKAADLGHTAAMRILGDTCYGSQREEWYTKGANLGDAVCMGKLAQYCLQNKRESEAEFWRDRALSNDNLYVLGYFVDFYLNEGKYDKAVEYFEKIAAVDINRYDMPGNWIDDYLAYLSKFGYNRTVFGWISTFEIENSSECYTYYLIGTYADMLLIMRSYLDRYANMLFDGKFIPKYENRAKWVMGRRDKISDIDYYSGAPFI